MISGKRGVDVDELEVLAELRARHGDVFRRRPGVLYVGDPVVAKTVLANADGSYRERSDFFHTSKGVFGPRAAQQELGRAARNLLRDHWTRHSPALPATVARVLGPASRWPDAGNLLLHHCFRDALVRPVGSGELRHLVDQVVRHAILTGARERRVSRASLRPRVRKALVAELARRRVGRTGEPADLLDVLAGAEPTGSSYAAWVQLAEVFLSCVYSVVGSMGFLLGWSVYLLGTEPGAGTDPAWAVREALRLWPVTWNLGRSPVRDHQLGDVEVSATDEVVVCSYLVHRDGRFWSDPDDFRPARWAAGSSSGADAFIPFGWGPHTCAAAGIVVDLVADVLRAMPPVPRWDLDPHRDRPHVGAALVPPEFTLRLTNG